MRRVLRYEVPADDVGRSIDLRGPIVHVATRDRNLVEIWVLDDDTTPYRPRGFRVYGTGHPVLGDYVGSAVTPDGVAVWHLFEVSP